MVCVIQITYIKLSFSQRKILKIKETYIGISSVRWELRFNNHIHSFSLKNQAFLEVEK